MKKCPECKNPMTLLLENYVCDWCDGLVEEEWSKEDVTEPMFFVSTASTGIDLGEWTPIDDDYED